MTALLHEFFSANRLIILSIYGQVFFILGLAIALQSWRHSRLALARTLNWLALFGFAHALHEWGYVFIPLQAQYMPRPFIDLLAALQPLLLAFSFACLLQFGVELLRPLPGRWRWLRYLAGAIFVAWLWWAWGSGLVQAMDTSAWHHAVTVWARYLIGFPGAALAAYGLYRQGRELAYSFQSTPAVRSLYLASLALLGYALVGGLVVLAMPFFPASYLNEEMIERATLIPVPVYRSFCGLLLAFAIIRSLEIFRIELDRRLMNLEEAQTLLAERARIGRELHDGTLQKIYAAGLLLRAVERDAERSDGDLRPDRLRQCGDLLNEAVADIRAYIGDLHEQADSRSLEVGLQEIAQARHLRSLVEVNLDLQIQAQHSLSPRYVGHVLAIAQEALSNVARHAQATRVCVTALGSEQCLELEIADNGQGMAEDYVYGYGLRNMHERARLLGGSLAIRSVLGRGTTVRLSVPWNDGHDPTTLVGSR